MMVIVGNDVPPAIRGMLKRWFIEPKPNVFVGTINHRTREKTLEYIKRNAPNLGLLIISTANNSQGFSISHFGPSKRKAVQYCGHYLIAEKWDEIAEQPVAYEDSE